MTRDVVSPVIRRLHATTPEELYEIGGWAHDAYFACVVQVDASIGPDVRIAVDDIDADVEVTDEIALYVRRDCGFESLWEGDADPPSELRPLGALWRIVTRLRR
jgi:hypothetical protein